MTHPWVHDLLNISQVNSMKAKISECRSIEFSQLRDKENYCIYYLLSIVIMVFIVLVNN